MLYFTLTPPQYIVHTSVSSIFFHLRNTSRPMCSLAILLWGYIGHDLSWRVFFALPCWVNLVFAGKFSAGLLLFLPSVWNTPSEAQTGYSDPILLQEHWVCIASEQPLHLIPVTMAILGCIFPFCYTICDDAFILFRLCSSKSACLEGFREVLRDIKICWAFRKSLRRSFFADLNYFMVISHVNLKAFVLSSVTHHRQSLERTFPSAMPPYPNEVCLLSSWRGSYHHWLPLYYFSKVSNRL